MQSAAVTDTKTPITIATVAQSMLKNESTIVLSGKESGGCIRLMRFLRGSYLIWINDAHHWAAGGVLSQRSVKLICP
jgi:hypothetical protein